MSSIKTKIFNIASFFLLKPVFLIINKSLRITINNREFINDSETNNKNYILAFWHGTMIVPWFIHRGKNFSAIVSLSKDGGILADLLTSLKYKVIRGSSSKGGKDAMNTIREIIRNGDTLLITPDGPRGPAEIMKAGAVAAAKDTGKPIILMGIKYFNAKVLKSWDSFQIPMPFSKIEINYSDPIFVKADADRSEVENIMNECGETLIKLCRGSDE